jgi:hypothetical protein
VYGDLPDKVGVVCAMYARRVHTVIACAQMPSSDYGALLDDDQLVRDALNCCDCLRCVVIVCVVACCVVDVLCCTATT